MMFSYFKHFLTFFNDDEHLAVPFVELARGGSLVGHLLFFCLHRITCLSIPTMTQASSYLLPKIFPVASILLSACLNG